MLHSRLDYDVIITQTNWGFMLKPCKSSVQVLGCRRRGLPLNPPHEFNQHFGEPLKARGPSTGDGSLQKSFFPPFFYQLHVFRISLLVSVVSSGIRGSSLAQENSNYWNKISCGRMRKADTATIVSWHGQTKAGRSTQAHGFRIM